MGKVRIPLDFIGEIERSITRPAFVRIWLSYISERYELSKELLELLEDVPYEEPSEEDGELLREITRTYFENRPLVYGIVSSDIRPPLKFSSLSDVNENNHIFAEPEWSFSEGIPLLYPESVERLLKDVLELAFIKIAFAKELPKKRIVCEIQPTDEEVRRVSLKYIKKKNIRVGGVASAVNHIQRYIRGQLTRTVEKELEYEVWELIGYEVNFLREHLRDLVRASVSSYMKDLKRLIRRMGREDPDGFLRYLQSGRPIMGYCEHPARCRRRFEDKDSYKNYVESRFMKDILDLQLVPEKADMSVIYRAIRDRRFRKIAEELLAHICRHVVRGDRERERIFVDMLFRLLRSHKKVLAFLERNRLDDLRTAVDGVMELKKKASYLRRVHQKVIDLFTEEGFPQTDNPIVEEAYEAYMNLLDREVLAHTRAQIHASVENLVWLFMDRDDLERAEALVRKAIEVGAVSPLFIEITGTLGLKFFDRFSEDEDVKFLEKSLYWYERFYELLYLEEISGSLEEEIYLFPRIYENLANYISIKLYNLISEEVGSEDELEKEWERMAEKMDFIEGLFDKYRTKPYEREGLRVGDLLLIKVRRKDTSPEEVFSFYLTTLKLYKVVYLLYSEGGEEEARGILREVLSNTPREVLKDINLPEFFTGWGLDYDELLSDL